MVLVGGIAAGMLVFFGLYVFSPGFRHGLSTAGPAPPPSLWVTVGDAEGLLDAGPDASQPVCDGVGRARVFEADRYYRFVRCVVQAGMDPPEVVAVNGNGVRVGRYP